MDGGKGGIGPNLTDKFWINQPEKTLFKNIYHVVENGSPNNPAMQASVKMECLQEKISKMLQLLYITSTKNKHLSQKKKVAQHHKEQKHIWANE